MSREKNDSVYVEHVIGIIKGKLGIESDKQIAELLGISKENFANKKSRGTAINLLFNLAIKNRLDLNEIFYPDEKICINNKMLKEIEEWLTQLVKKDKEKEIWFRHQFKESFPGYVEWQERKEEKGSFKPSNPIKKVA